MGRVLGAQVRLLPGERLAPSYAEPLWRRIADGPLAPTRRVTGGSQPEAAACGEAGEQALPGLAQQTLGDPCQGPFAVESQGTWAGAVGNAIPQLSADGDTVAFLSRAPLISLGSDYGRSTEGETDDLYVANMQEGLTRTEALRPLTQLASGHETDPASDAPIVDVAVSADGTQVAFATERTEFPLGSPAYISPPRTVAGMSELYDVNLADETVTRVSNGYEGGPSEHSHKTVQAGETDPYVHRTDGALSPAFSATATRSCSPPPRPTSSTATPTPWPPKPPAAPPTQAASMSSRAASSVRRPPKRIRQNRRPSRKSHSNGSCSPPPSRCRTAR